MKITVLLTALLISVSSFSAQIGYDYGDDWLDYFDNGDDIVAHAIIDYGNGLCYQDDPFAAFNEYFKLGGTYGADYGVLGMMTITDATVAETSEGAVLIIKGDSTKEGRTTLELPVCPDYE